MGHEMGHHVLNHAYKGLVMTGVLIVIGFAFLNWALNSSLARWGEKWEVRGVTDVAGDCPVWCAQRFGQSLTLLPDGRAIQIGGEHEDYYDSDFCIYNDVFVHHADGRIDIFCYPEDVFSPTDFHTATLIGDAIYIIGGLGYQGSRRFGETPVHRLDTNTLQIHRVDTTGKPPGWISRHRAALVSPNEIRVWGGKIAREVGETESYDDNHGSWVFDVTGRRWLPQQTPG